MKRRIYAAVLLVSICVSLFAGCESTSQDNPVGSEPLSGINSNGNIVNGGEVVAYDGYVYFSLRNITHEQQDNVLVYHSDVNIYRVKEDGGDVQKIHSCHEKMGDNSQIDIADDWVYFTDVNPSGDDIGIWKMRPNGEEVVFLFDTPCAGWFRVIDGYFYFGLEYRMKIGENKPTSIFYHNSASGQGTDNIVGDYIYTCNRESGTDKIIKLSTDGTGKTVLFEGRANCMVVDGDWIYFENQNDFNDSLYKMKTDGSELQKVFGQEVGAINVYEDWLYCNIEIDGQRGLYKIKKDGTEYKLLADVSVWSIYIANDWLYYSLSESNKETLYKMKLDGTEHQLVYTLE